MSVEHAGRPALHERLSGEMSPGAFARGPVHAPARGNHRREVTEHRVADLRERLTGSASRRASTAVSGLRQPRTGPFAAAITAIALNG